MRREEPNRLALENPGAAFKSRLKLSCCRTGIELAFAYPANGRFVRLPEFNIGGAGSSFRTTHQQAIDRGFARRPARSIGLSI